jgi:heme/copper-type cytochrome/quinol oxidase subunit 1
MNRMIEGLRNFVLPMRPASRYRWLAYLVLAVTGFLLVFVHSTPMLLAILLAVAIIAASVGFSVSLMWLAGLSALIALVAKTSVVFASAGADRHLHNTYYVAYPRYGFAMLAGVVLVAIAYHLLPRISGYRYKEYFGMAHVWTTLAGLSMMVAPQFMMMFIPNKLEGIPRRYLDYPEAFSIWNQWYNR